MHLLFRKWQPVPAFGISPILYMADKFGIYETILIKREKCMTVKELKEQLALIDDNKIVNIEVVYEDNLCRLKCKIGEIYKIAYKNNDVFLISYNTK